MFDNLGYGYNAVINGLSIFILKTQVNNSTNPISDFFVNVTTFMFYTTVHTDI